MDEIITALNELDEQPDSVPVPAQGKTLYIKPDTPDFDYRSLLGQVVQYVNMGHILDKIKAGTQYVIQIPTEFQKAYEAGDLFIMQNQKTGKMWPSLMKVADNGRNQVVSPLPIAEQGFVQGNPVQDLSVSYHNVLMHQQMARLTAMVEDTYRMVERIEHGQMDDRIGRLEAGKNGMLLALSMPDGNERTMQINSSRQNLLVAQAQIGQTLQRRVAEFVPLPKTATVRFFKELAHTGYLEIKDREVSEMQEYYELYLQATKLIAASYAICDDINTAEETFRIGEQFIQSIDFRNVKSIGYSHKDVSDMFFDHATEYLITEKTIYLDESKKFDYVALKVSGEELLEAINNERDESVSKEDTK